MKTAIITGIITGLVGIIGAVIALFLILIVSSMVLSDIVPAQTFGYYFRPFALLVIICAGVFYIWLGYILTRQD